MWSFCKSYTVGELPPSGRKVNNHRLQATHDQRVVINRGMMTSSSENKTFDILATVNAHFNGKSSR